MITRKQFILGAAACALTAAPPVISQTHPVLNLKLGEKIAPIGMGTWQTFDVAPTGIEFEQRRQVLKSFFEFGGNMIDSSPMYGRSEAALGALMEGFDRKPLFSATKIWAAFDQGGPMQLSNSEKLWKEPKLDLVYVHNLLRWEAHLRTLKDARQGGRVRFIGLTTSHGRRHQQLEKLMKTEPIDAVQFSYNIANRAAENRLLPLAMDQGLSVVINRPFMTGQLFKMVERHALPEWATEFGIYSWAEYFLKFVISHPAVTCTIPATRQVSHMKENMQALSGALPDAALRRRMISYFDDLI